ncbi:MAG: polyphosphate kinase 2 family protein [Chromatiales bacterium]|nr:polyphosphate kinase 2 family protein [Chromatiales bacterium]
MVIEPVESRHLVPFDGAFRLDGISTRPPDGAAEGKSLKKRLNKIVDGLDEWQRRLYAADTHAVLLVFQAMDAAGKDSTIRAVLRGIDPAGCQVFSFKQPSKEELDHDFLWRTARCLPEKGRVGVFNRSYYEEVLVVRVHPEFLGGQRIDVPNDLDALWEQRYTSIREHERHLAANGTLILKFWLNVSYEEQRRRFLSRLEEPEKNWKFAVGDVKERARWNDYMQAYEAALAATSRPWAPWYAIPADDKPYMRWKVAAIVRKAFARLAPAYPTVAEDERVRFDEMRTLLESQA